MPFAGLRRLIAGGPERLGQEMLLQWHSTLGSNRGVNALTDRRPSGEERRSGGAAQRKRVVAIQFDALANEAVNVGRADLAAVIAHVIPAEVVGQHEHDVRIGRGDERQGEAKESTNQHWSFRPDCGQPRAVEMRLSAGLALPSVPLSRNGRRTRFRSPGAADLPPLWIRALSGPRTESVSQAETIDRGAVVHRVDSAFGDRDAAEVDPRFHRVAAVVEFLAGARVERVENRRLDIRGLPVVD